MVEGAPTVKQGPSRERELRHGTVLFVDLVGFTSLAERLEHEDLAEVIDAYLDLVDGVARRYGARIEKHIGDATAAFFGTAEVLEDAPRAAINAAIEILAALDRRNATPGTEGELAVHIGINSGPMTRTRREDGVEEYRMVGDTINVAARLMSESAAGQILIGAETYSHARHHFEYRSLGSLALKGRSEPLPTYEVLSREPNLYRRRASAPALVVADLIGREAELARLEYRLSGLATGRGGVLVLLAEAGLGKSRLLAELVARTPLPGLLALEARSVAVGQSMGFHPIADLLRSWSGISERSHDPLAQLREATRDLLGAEAAEVTPYLATLLGLELDGADAERVRQITEHSRDSGLENLILRSISQLLDALSERQPLLLVFEDVHWADASSLRVLDHLLALVRRRPILVLLAARPGLGGPFQTTLERLRQQHSEDVEVLALQPLDERQSLGLLDRLFRGGDVPGRLRAEVLARAGGNPFYIEEVIRALLESGSLELADGRLRATSRAELASVPATVRDVIRSRIDGLRASTLELLRILAVAGGSLPYSLIEAIARPREHLEEDLQQLIDLQLLVFEQGRFAFKHTIATEVAYESIPRRARQETHEEVARAIEEGAVPGFSSAAMLAYHHVRAGDAERSERFLIAAGEEASRNSASDEALRFFQHALQLYTERHLGAGSSTLRALLEKNIARAFHARGHHIEAAEHFSRALDLLGHGAPRSRLHRAGRFSGTSMRIGWTLFFPDVGPRKRQATDVEREVIDLMRRRAEAETTAEPIRFLFDTLETHREIASVDPKSVEEIGGLYAGLIGILSWGGLSFGLGERALRLAERYADPSSVSERVMLEFMAYVHRLLRGDWQRDHPLPNELEEQALRYGCFWHLAGFLGLAAEQLAYQGRFGEAELCVEKLSKLVEVYGYHYAISTRDYTAAFLLLQRGLVNPANEALELYCARHREDNFNVYGLGQRAKAQMLVGDRAGARESLRSAEAIIRRSGIAVPYYRSHYLRSRLLSDVLDLEEARDSSDDASVRQIARRARATIRSARWNASRVAWQQPEIYLLIGSFRWLCGRRSAAARWWERSLSASARLGMKPAAAHAHLEIGRHLERCGAAIRIAGREGTWHVARGRELRLELGLRDA
jgi:class 3 adenylate cyclase